jgi:hypothetical protein
MDTLDQLSTTKILDNIPLKDVKNFLQTQLLQKKNNIVSIESSKEIIILFKNISQMILDHINTKILQKLDAPITFMCNFYPGTEKRKTGNWHLSDLTEDYEMSSSITAKYFKNVKKIKKITIADSFFECSILKKSQLYECNFVTFDKTEKGFVKYTHPVNVSNRNGKPVIDGNIDFIFQKWTSKQTTRGIYFDFDIINKHSKKNIVPHEFDFVLLSKSGGNINLIKNPLTNRMINKNGSTIKNLLKRYEQKEIKLPRLFLQQTL